MILSKGGVYNGQLINELPHGIGTEYRNGVSFYCGNWICGNPDGFGVDYHPNGMVCYVGEKKNGLNHGQGISYFLNGSKDYEGPWKNGLPINNDDLQEVGPPTTKRKIEDFHKDEMNKKMRMSDGILVRNLILDKENSGTAILPNGAHYEGQLRNNIPHGYGKTLFSDGRIYIGQWKNGYPHGKGISYHKDGKTKAYEGEWENGSYFGVGTFWRPNKTKGYYGEWQNGMSHGEGTAFDKDGTTIVLQGEWENGKFLG